MATKLPSRHTNPSAAGRVPFGVLAVFALFLIVVSYLVGSSFVRRGVPTFALRPAVPGAATPRVVLSDTVTVDARDPVAWRFFDFDRGSVVMPPDTAGWDLAFRRFHVIASGGVLDLGTIAFDSLSHVPLDGYLATRLGADTSNPAINRWYTYNFLSHLLESKERTYVVRTEKGTHAKMTVLSYYCHGLTPGCVTIRYAYPVEPAATD